MRSASALLAASALVLLAACGTKSTGGASDGRASFDALLREAKAAGRPVVIDFWATWCAPCRLLKKETFADPAVAEALKKVQLIEVDVDKQPELAQAYGVSAIPDVRLLDSAGQPAGRLMGFEPPAQFLQRIQKLLK